MQSQEWTKVAHHPQLDVELLHAYYVQHAYPRHSHDYYVLSLIERGRQSFTHKGTKYRTPPGGLILINPGAVHTGEATDAQGFELRALYPSISFMETATFELTSRRALPFFKEVLVDHRWATSNISSLHRAKLFVYAFTLFSTFLATMTKNVTTLLFVVTLLARVAFCAASTWALFGTAIRTYLQQPRLKMFINIILSLSLVYTAISLSGIL